MIVLLVALIAGRPLKGQNGSTAYARRGDDQSRLIGTVHEWPSDTTLTTLLLIAWAFSVFLFRRTVRVITWHKRNDSTGSRRWFWFCTVEIGVELALVRVSTLWYMTYLNWSGKESMGELGLLLFLLPEVLVVPHHFNLTASNVWLLSLLLTIGSITLAVIVGIMIRVGVIGRVR